MNVNIRRILAAVCLVFLAAAAVSAADPDTQVTRQADRLERYLYGSAQTGAVGERLDRVEKDLLGRRTGQKPPDKAQTLFNFVFKGTDTAPSLDMKMNFLEWKVFNETRQGKLPDRVAALDTFVIGAPSSEPLAFRVEQLIHMSLDNGIISLHRVTIPAGTPIRVKLGKTVSSRDSREGDSVPLTICEDLFLEKNILAIGKGGLLSGELDKVRRGRRFGRSGYVKLAVSEVAAIDSKAVPVKISGLGEEFDKKKLGMAAGASALGYLVMGPVGLVGGAFIKGADVSLPEGTILNLTTTRDIAVLGVVINRP